MSSRDQPAHSSLVLQLEALTTKPGLDVGDLNLGPCDSKTGILLTETSLQTSFAIF